LLPDLTDGKLGKLGSTSCVKQNHVINFLSTLKPGNGSCYRVHLELDLPEGKDEAKSCQWEKMKLDPASGKTWSWIKPIGKHGTGSCQQENLELDLANKKTWK
jgi:hypothetical protein